MRTSIYSTREEIIRFIAEEQTEKCCVCVCPAVVVDGGAAEGPGGTRVLGVGGLGAGAHQAVSAAAEQHTGRHTKRHQGGRGAHPALTVRPENQPHSQMK